MRFNITIDKADMTSFVNGLTNCANTLGIEVPEKLIAEADAAFTAGDEVRIGGFHGIFTPNQEGTSGTIEFEVTPDMIDSVASKAQRGAKKLAEAVKNISAARKVFAKIQDTLRAHLPMFSEEAEDCSTTQEVTYSRYDIDPRYDYAMFTYYVDGPVMFYECGVLAVRDNETGRCWFDNMVQLKAQNQPNLTMFSKIARKAETEMDEHNLWADKEFKSMSEAEAEARFIDYCETHKA